MKLELKKNHIAIAIVVILFLCVFLYFYFKEDDNLTKKSKSFLEPGGGAGGAQSSGQSQTPPATSTTPLQSEIRVGDVVKAKWDTSKVWKDDYDKGRTTELSFITKKDELLGKVYAFKDNYYKVFNGSRGGWIYKDSLGK